MNPLLPALEKKIREICPDLQKLEFGCKIRICNDEGIFVRLTHYPEGGYSIGYMTPDSPEYNVSYVSTLEEIEILGKPIELQHVLRAIGGEYAVDGQGKIVHEDFEGYFTIFGIYFDLSKSFTDQTPQFYEWLDGVLNVIN